VKPSEGGSLNRVRVPDVPWHAIPPGEALYRLGSASGGLADSEAAERLARHGPNAFQATRAVPAWVVLIGQLRSVIVLLLAVGAAIALLSGDALDAAAIGVVLVLNVAIGFVTELRAHRAMEALLTLEVTRAHVVRQGRTRAIDARALVPGDVIELEAGQTVPADARLLNAAELRTVEASLTGEPVPVDKAAVIGLAADVPLPDRITMVYKATTAVAGRGRAVVVATGMDTEVGRIGTLVGGITAEPTPLERRLDQLGHRLALVALLVAALVAGLEALHDVPLSGIVQTAIALAVAAVPEGLPVVGTIAMAIGMRRMARRRALVRRLPVVETLGSATVVCTDKTGTLTAGEMTVTVVRLLDREIAVSGAGIAPEGAFAENGVVLEPREDERLLLALRIGALANRSDVSIHAGVWQASGDPTEAALVVAARKAGLDPAALREDWPEIGELPFSSERMLMATFHRVGKLVACVKGAPRRVLELTDRVLTAEGPRTLHAGERDELLRVNQKLAARGFRVLALAMKDVDAVGEAQLRGLTWVGFVGLSDPPAPGVSETIRVFRDAGIRTVMLTGDQKLTAETVARQLGLLGPADDALDGREVEALSDDQLRGAVARTAVFSRVGPEAKLRIVRAYQARGEIVAMLGDGVNDAAALRKADIGVVMGVRGTDLAKEAAEVVLQDDRFPTIAAAIEEGRVIFDNIRKFVFYLFSCNLAEIMVLLGAGIVGLPVPLLPLQILWLNLLTDTFPALALAVEPAEPGTMRQPPRDPKAAILSAPMLRATVGYALLIAAVSITAFAWGLSGPTGGHGRARSLAFMTLALAQIFHLGNARSDLPVTAPARALSNRFAVGAVLLTVGLQLLAVVLPPLAAVLRIERLDGIDWAAVGTLSLLPAIAGQVLKWIRADRRRRAPATRAS
jgi:Ca2+-transporting ATPase